MYLNASICQCCIFAKQTRKHFSKYKHRKLPDFPFQQIGTDMKGPIKDPTGLHGEQWIISFICARTKFKVIYTIANKNDTYKALNTFITEFIKSLTIESKDRFINLYTIKRIHSDMGREYLGKFEDLCQQYQINHPIYT